jgi:putative DNA primase/helicase
MSRHVLMASDVKVRPIVWDWFPYVPRGELSCLVGPMDTGKSQWVNWMVARITREGGGVAMLSGEENPATTLTPRLLAAGADVSRVGFIRGAALEIEVVREACAVIPELRLITVDPITHFLPPGKDAYKTQHVREVLGALVKFAHDHGPTLIVVQHVNRDMKAPDALSRIADSQGLPQLARSILMWGRDNGSHRVLARAKANLAPPEAGMAESFEMRAREIPHAGSHPYVVHVGSSSSNAEDVIATAEQRSALDEAREFLEEFLAEGMQESGKVKAAAAAAGIGPYPLRRARERWVRSVRPGKTTGPYYWELIHPPYAPPQHSQHTQHSQQVQANAVDAVDAVKAEEESGGGTDADAAAA